ncbi:MAG TPA: ABC transporter permease [Fimbriimonadaceae bacterium]|mgnify:CR=1 FL=1|nr:ABC transporter permease [Fimbriimonadaceae bacterium]
MNRHPLLSWLSRYANVAGLLLALAAIFLFFWTQIVNTEGIHTFAKPENLQLIARQATIVGLAALGMTFVIISGGIDLSVGSAVALVSVVIAWFLRAGYDPAVALMMGLVAGAACGLLNGSLITGLKVTPFIVTLGTLLIFRGVAKWIGDEKKIDADLTWLNDLLRVLGKDEKWKVFPEGVWMTILLAVFLALVLRSSRFGRNVMAVGGNEQATRYAGVAVGKVRLAVYILMGFFVGMAGLMQFTRLSVGDPTVAQGLELDVIAAVVIGGASLSGGQGSIFGTIIGVLIMATIRAGCSQMGLSNYIQEIVTGGIIVAAIGLDRLRSRRSA